MKKLTKGDVVTLKISLPLGPKQGEYGTVVNDQNAFWDQGVLVDFEREGKVEQHYLSPRLLIKASPLELLARCAT